MSPIGLPAAPWQLKQYVRRIGFTSFSKETTRTNSFGSSFLGGGGGITSIFGSTLGSTFGSTFGSVFGSTFGSVFGSGNGGMVLGLSLGSGFVGSGLGEVRSLSPSFGAFATGECEDGGRAGS